MNTTTSKIVFSPTYLAEAINKAWNIPADLLPHLTEHYLLYHSAGYIVNNSWEAGRILRAGTFYHVVFHNDLTYSDLRKSNPSDQFALSFRCPSYALRNKYKYLVPTVLIADPRKITLNGRIVENV